MCAHVQGGYAFVRTTLCTSVHSDLSLAVGYGVNS